MKNMLVFISLAFSYSILAQIPNDLSKSVELGKWEIPTSKGTKLEILERVKGNENFEWTFYSLKNGDSSNVESLHVVDFNCDGILDIIYNGYVGAESKRVIFMKGNSDGKYTYVIALWGLLVELSSYDGYTPLRFVINNYACCAGMINHIERYTPVWNNSQFGYELQAKYSMYYNTDLPNSRFDKPIGFKTLNEKYYLRLNPYIDNTILLDHEEEGNIFAEYPKGSEGIAIAEKSDDSGRIWWFVLMKNNLKPKWSLYAEGDNNDEPTYYIGWISSNYVERID